MSCPGKQVPASHRCLPILCIKHRQVRVESRKNYKKLWGQYFQLLHADWLLLKGACSMLIWEWITNEKLSMAWRRAYQCSWFHLLWTLPCSGTDTVHSQCPDSRRSQHIGCCTSCKRPLLKNKEMNSYVEQGRMTEDANKWIQDS